MRLIMKRSKANQCFDHIAALPKLAMAYAVGLKFEPYRWRDPPLWCDPCGVTWDSPQGLVV